MSCGILFTESKGQKRGGVIIVRRVGTVRHIGRLFAAVVGASLLLIMPSADSGEGERVGYSYSDAGDWSSPLVTHWSSLAAAEVAKGLEEKATSYSFIRRAEIDVSLPLGNRPWSTGVAFLGSFLDDGSHMLGWELRGYAGRKAFRGLGETPDAHKGGSFGLIYRNISSGGGPFGFGRKGSGLIGLNAFTDYESRYEQEFIRWSGGIEARSPWLDIYGNIYRALTSPRLGERIGSEENYEQESTFTSDGFDAKLHIHAPDSSWISLLGEYYNWDDYKGGGGEKGWRGGLRLEPTTLPLLLEVIYEDGDAGKDWGGRIGWSMDIGEGKRAPTDKHEFSAQEHLYAVVNREYVQRIYDVTLTVSPMPEPPRVIVTHTIGVSPLTTTLTVGSEVLPDSGLPLDSLSGHEVTHSGNDRMGFEVSVSFDNWNGSGLGAFALTYSPVIVSGGVTTTVQGMVEIEKLPGDMDFTQFGGLTLYYRGADSPGTLLRGEEVREVYRLRTSAPGYERVISEIETTLTVITRRNELLVSLEGDEVEDYAINWHNFDKNMHLRGI